MKEPWTCPNCGRQGVRAGSATHLAFCGGRSEKMFWAKVDKRDPEECWAWTGAKFRRQKKQIGYGRFAGSGPFTYAHRAAWIFTHGPIPDGKCIMHSCDEPLCCNPGHMSLGTDADNAADKVAKDRHARGERNHSAKLTDDQVREIMRLYKKTGPRRGNAAELAERYGVSPGAIAAIGRGETWKHLH